MTPGCRPCPAHPPLFVAWAETTRGDLGGTRNVEKGDNAEQTPRHRSRRQRHRPQAQTRKGRRRPPRGSGVTYGGKVGFREGGRGRLSGGCIRKPGRDACPWLAGRDACLQRGGGAADQRPARIQLRPHLPTAVIHRSRIAAHQARPRGAAGVPRAHAPHAPNETLCTRLGETMCIRIPTLCI
jgi:hypothetical protein